MSGLFQSVKADLLDRRLRVIVIVVAVALVAALGFAFLSGGSQSATPTASTGTASGTPVGTPSIAGSSASNPKAASAETTFGSAYQHSTHVGDPFITLPSTETTTTTTGSASSSSASEKSSSSGSSGSGSSGESEGSSHPSSGSSGSSGSTPTPPAPKPTTHTTYAANVELGPAPVSPTEPALLQTYKNVRIGQALPNKTHPLVVLKGASLETSSGAKSNASSATFSLVSSPIVNGPGACVPSDTQCESVKLTGAQTEELQYVEANGQTVTYLLRVTEIKKLTVNG